MPETITSLIEKLEGAGVGSRELDREIALRLESKLWLVSSGRHKVERNGRAVNMPAYSTSLDAALALAERVVGSKEALLLLNDLLTREADVSDFDLITISDLPRLLCVAILRAKQ